jgi:hypothetical protein
MVGAISLDSACAESGRQPRRSQHVTPGIGLIHLGAGLSNASNRSRYSLVIVSRDDAGRAAGLPGRSLVISSGTSVPTTFNNGVPYRRARAKHWLLAGANGGLLENKPFKSYIGDVGSAGYQQAFITNTLAFLGAHPGLDGIFVDDVLRDIGPLTGAYPSKYPTQPAWQEAMASFVAVVGSALRAQGYYVLVNAVGYTSDNSDSNDGTLDVSWWQQLGPSVNGLMNEDYQQTAEGSLTLRNSGTDTWMQNWDGWQRLITTAQSMGKDFVGITYGPADDTRAMSYGKASFLQEWDGGGSVFIFKPTDDSDPWNPDWTTDIGQPAAAKQQVGTGWMRRYTNGIALVNPSPGNTQTFQLGGTYLTAAGATVTSLTLPPTTGSILRNG